MKFASTIILIFSLSCSFAKSDIDSDFSLYVTELSALPANGADSSAQEFVQACISKYPSDKKSFTSLGEANDSLRKLIALKRRPLDVSDSFSRQYIAQEDGIYQKTLFAYAQTSFSSAIPLHLDLLERKYFKNDITKQSNFIEGYINGRLPLTKSSIYFLDEKDSHLGVNPWEVLFRFEPAILYSEEFSTAIIGTLGLGYTMLPNIIFNNEDNSFSSTETLASEYLKKSGFRIGAGISGLTKDPQFVMGAGFTIRGVAIWGVNEFDRGYGLALGFSNLSYLRILSNFLPGFD